jgi:hypothetical protein
MSARLLNARHAVAPVELGYGILLASTFVLPYWIDFYAWIPALCLATALAALQGWRSGRAPVLPLAMVLYLAAYAIAGLHSDPATFSIIEAGKYFAPPVLALTIAWAAQSPATRRNLVLLAVVAVAIQLPVAMAQAAHTVAQAVPNPDTVTGLLASDQSNVLGQVGVLAAVLVFVAGSVGKLPFRWALAGTLALLALGVLCSSKVDYILAPVGLGVTALVLWLETPGRRALRAPALAAAVCAVAIFPALYGGMDALYPGENSSLLEAQNLTPTQQRHWSASVRASHAGDQQSRSKANSAAGQKRLTVLPGRVRQLHLALRLSVNDGPVVALLGRGIGDTRYKRQSFLGASSAMTSDPITRREQKTNSIWVARLLTETGYLGLLAFVGLEAYLLVLWWRNRRVDPRSGWDSVVIYALPGITAMTLISGLYNTALAIQPYATLFWPLLGIAIAVDRQRRINRSAEAPATSGLANSPHP